MPTFVCLDTNILIRVATQGKKGCEVERWQELCKLATESRLTILLPIVVRLEFRKQLREFDDDFKDGMKAFDAALKTLCNDTKGVWNEATDLVADLWPTWNRLRDARVKDCNARFQQIDEWLRSTPKGVEVLPFDEKILAKVKMRRFGGGHPRQKKGAGNSRLEGDLAIIETLIAFFNPRTGVDDSLLLCTENVKDFAVEVDGQYFLHKHFSFDLPSSKDAFTTAAQAFTDLASMLDFIRKNVPIQEPTQEQIEHAETKADAEAEGQFIIHDGNTGETKTVSVDNLGRRLPPIAATLMEQISERSYVEVGAVIFRRHPVLTTADYESTYRGLRFIEAKEICESLWQGKVTGVIGNLLWREGLGF
jgi:hypothetical protein